MPASCASLRVISSWQQNARLRWRQRSPSPVDFTSNVRPTLARPRITSPHLTLAAPRGPQTRPICRLQVVATRNGPKMTSRSTYLPGLGRKISLACPHIYCTRRLCRPNRAGRGSPAALRGRHAAWAPALANIGRKTLTKQGTHSCAVGFGRLFDALFWLLLPSAKAEVPHQKKEPNGGLAPDVSKTKRAAKPPPNHVARPWTRACLIGRRAPQRGEELFDSGLEGPCKHSCLTSPPHKLGHVL
jgi:hypothetical protein